MYTHTLDAFIAMAEKKVALQRSHPLAFYIGAIAGGAYIGLGILLIFSIGAALPASVQKLAMGLTFGIALILVVIAGAELFTGYTLYMTLGLLAGKVSLRAVLGSWAGCWLGNLAGAMLVAALFAVGGANGLLSDPQSLLYHAADYKMSGTPAALLAKGILCNWLVCLALWMSSRVQGDVAKCMVISWCLLAFIASGYEHCVANMTLLGLALMGRHGDWATLVSALYNLGLVTLGNVMGGALMVGGLYWLADQRGLRVPPASAPLRPAQSAAPSR